MPTTFTVRRAASRNCKSGRGKAWAFAIPAPRPSSLRVPHREQRPPFIRNDPGAEYRPRRARQASFQGALSGSTVPPIS
jgi:hypothetical protein